MDFASLYPSIIRAFNICLTTLIPPELEDSIPAQNCHLIEFDEENETNDGEGSDDEQLGDFMRSTKRSKTKKVTQHKYKFIKQNIREGIIPQLVRNLVLERRAVRQHLDGVKNEETGEWIVEKERDPLTRVILDRRQWALKITANSFFGLLGVQEGGKLPLIEGARSITAKGRELINYVNKYLQDKYNAQIVYNDTDSSMVDLKIQSTKEAVARGKALALEVSELFPDPLRMEFEKAGRMLCIKKKKYAIVVLDKEGNFKFDDKDILKKGIILARRDNCKWIRRIYMCILKNILMKKGMIETLDIIVDEVYRLFQGDIPYEQLLIIRELGSHYESDSYFMKVFADQLRKLGKIVNPGDRLEYVVAKTDNIGDKVGMKMRDSETYKDRRNTSTPEEIDYLYYLDHVMKNPIDQLFGIGYNKELREMGQIGYKPFGRYHFRSINEPIRMMVRMLMDNRDVSDVKRMIRTNQFPKLVFVLDSKEIENKEYPRLVLV